MDFLTVVEESYCCASQEIPMDAPIKQEDQDRQKVDTHIKQEDQGYKSDAHIKQEDQDQKVNAHIKQEDHDQKVDAHIIQEDRIQKEDQKKQKVKRDQKSKKVKKDILPTVTVDRKRKRAKKLAVLVPAPFTLVQPVVNAHIKQEDHDQKVDAHIKQGDRDQKEDQKSQKVKKDILPTVTVDRKQKRAKKLAVLVPAPFTLVQPLAVMNAHTKQEDHDQKVLVDAHIKQEDHHQKLDAHIKQEDRDQKEDQKGQKVKKDILPTVTIDRKRKRSKRARKLAVPLVQPWPVDPNAYSETVIDKAYRLLTDLDIIQALRQFIPPEDDEYQGAVTSPALLMAPLEQPIDVPKFLAEWTKINPVRIVTDGPAGSGKSCCVNQYLSSNGWEADWEASISVVKAGTTRCKNKKHLGLYKDKVEAQRAVDKVKVKMMLCGVKRAPGKEFEDLNFPLHRYYEEMAKDDVQYIDNYLFYIDYVLHDRAARNLIARGFRPVEGMRGVFRTAVEKPSAMASASGDEIPSVAGSSGDHKPKQEQDPPALVKYIAQPVLDRNGCERRRRGKLEGHNAPRHDTKEEAGAQYDRSLITHGLFLRPGIRDYRPNHPLCNYLQELMTFVGRKGLELGKTPQQITDVQKSLGDIITRGIRTRTSSPQAEYSRLVTI